MGDAAVGEAGVGDDNISEAGAEEAGMGDDGVGEAGTEEAGVVGCSGHGGW